MAGAGVVMCQERAEQTGMYNRATFRLLRCVPYRQRRH